MVSQLKTIFDNSSKLEEYKRTLRDIDIRQCIIDLLNDLFATYSELMFVDDALQYVLANDIEKAIIAQREELNLLLSKLNKGKFEIADMVSLLKIDYNDFTASFFIDLGKGLQNYIQSLSEMQDFAIAEQNLSEFCSRHGLEDPDEKYAKNDTMSLDIVKKATTFTSDLWEDKTAQYSQEANKKQALLGTIEKYQNMIITDPLNAVFYSARDPRLGRYFSSNGKLYNYSGLRQRTIAVLDAKGKHGGFDLVFTDEGIVPYKDETVKAQVLYKDIRWKNKEHSELLIGESYKGYVANLENMYLMIQELKLNCSVPTQQGAPFWDAILGAIGIKK